MSLRHKRPGDSLDLLLDTMCNAFGGIILMAVLLALLSQHQRQNRSTASTDSDEILRRRIEVAETNLLLAARTQSDLLALTNDEKLRERFRLIQEQKQLQLSLTEAQRAIDTKQPTTTDKPAADPADRLKQITEEMKVVNARKVEQENALKTAGENIQRLKSRLSNIEKQLVNIQDQAVRKLRLPRERSTTKHAFNVILQYGKIYPLRIPQEGMNNRMIDWTMGDTYAIPQPKRNAGLDPVLDIVALRRLFGQLSQNDYVAFYVFEDSFGGFSKAREAAVAAGLDYGWEPLPLRQAPLTFGASGTSPKPQ